MNASRVHLDAFVADAGRLAAPGALVLDAGAGGGVYRHHFAHTRYESADFKQVDGKRYAQDITYVGDLASIPVEDDRFDMVVITQVLEHLPEPITVLQEMHRVLRAGGTIVASCPLYYEEHEQPYDFHRYTQFALRRMFDVAGFNDIKIEWLEGYLATVGYQLEILAREIRQPWRKPFNLASRLCYASDIRHKRTHIGHPKNYTVIAKA